MTSDGLPMTSSLYLQVSERAKTGPFGVEKMEGPNRSD